MRHLAAFVFVLIFAAFGVVSLTHDQHTYALIGFSLAAGLAIPAQLTKAIGAMRGLLPFLDRRSEPRGVKDSLTTERVSDRTAEQSSVVGPPVSPWEDDA